MHQLELKVKPGVDVAYPVVELWVDKATDNVLKRQEFALSGRLMRTLYYPKWKKIYQRVEEGATSGSPRRSASTTRWRRPTPRVMLIKSVDLQLAGRQHVHQGLAGVEEPMSRWAVVAAVLFSLAARAQRPDEDALFGGKPDGGTAAAPRPSEESLFGAAPDGGTGSGPASAAGAQESRGLDLTPSSDAFATGRVKEDPLKIGGLFYTRAFLSVAQDQPFDRRGSRCPRWWTCTSMPVPPISCGPSSSGG